MDISNLVDGDTILLRWKRLKEKVNGERLSSPREMGPVRGASAVDDVKTADSMGPEFSTAAALSIGT